MYSIASQLRDDKHKVDVLTSQPSRHLQSITRKMPRDEVTERFRVTRLNLPNEDNKPILRIFNALSLGFQILIRSLINQYDLIICTSIPPILGGFFSALASKLTGARLIYYCMDLHPEIGDLSGDFSNPFLYKNLALIDDWTCLQASLVLVHSQDMKKTLLSRKKGAKYNIEIMNNFAVNSNDEDENNQRNEFKFANNQLRVVYAGNVGRFQGLDMVLEAMGALSERKGIELLIMGDGIEKENLIEIQKKNGANVTFLDQQPLKIAKGIIKKADIGLVSIVPGVYKYAYPSKTMAYLEQGIPLISMVEKDSELSSRTKQEGYGFSIPPNDQKAFFDLMISLSEDNSWKSEMSTAARVAFEKHFSATVVLSKWSKLVSKYD